MEANEAAELLAAANNAPASVGQDAGLAAPPENIPADPEATASQGTTEGQTVEESFLPKGIDPTSLPPELQELYKGMQAHFTRSQQALRERETALDGLNVDDARQALQFVDALNTDPQYAMQVHSELTTALQGMGLSPAQAQQAATETLTGEQDPFGEPQQASVPPEILQRLDNQEQFIQQFQTQQQMQALEAELTRAEMEIRQANSSWDQSDIDTVYRYAHANGGDLRAAAQQYQDDSTRLMARLLAQKSSVPTGQPSGSGPGQAAPSSFKDLNEATAAAMEHFRASFD